jgi:hypothetical protein
VIGQELFMKDTEFFIQLMEVNPSMTIPKGFLHFQLLHWNIKLVQITDFLPEPMQESITENQVWINGNVFLKGCQLLV